MNTLDISNSQWKTFDHMPDAGGSEKIELINSWIYGNKQKSPHSIHIYFIRLIADVWNKHVTCIRIPIVTHSLCALCKTKTNRNKKEFKQCQSQNRHKKQIHFHKMKRKSNRNVSILNWIASLNAILFELACVRIQNEIWINKYFPFSKVLHVIQSSIGAMLFCFLIFI